MTGPLEGLVQLQPPGPANDTLARNTRPSDWVNPEPASRYNLVVIGGGTAGLVCAAAAAGLGARVALVERELLGGDCLNVGCVPSKALLAAAHRAADVRDAAGLGVHADGGCRVDFPAVMERMRELRASFSHHDSVQRFAGLGVDVYLGSGSFSGPDTVVVEGRALRFGKAVIATGTRPAVPAIPGLDGVDCLTNKSVFSLAELPPRLAVIGAGPVGCEMAQAFARFGSSVCLIEAQQGILPGEDPEASAPIRHSLARDGVTILCGSREPEARQQPDGIHLRLAADGETRRVVVDRLLVAAGRTPNIDGLGLEKAGVDWQPQGVIVNDHLQTTNPRIYAAGDVCTPYRFTHAADFMARTVVRNALFRGRARASALVIPWCIYTAPELARIGLDARQAAEQGIAIDTFTEPLEGNDRAVIAGETAGFVQLRVRRGTDRIVGATIVASHAGELIPQLSLAMTHGLGLRAFASTIYPYPTRSEAIRRIGDQYLRGRLTPGIKAIFSRWLTWQR